MKSPFSRMYQDDNNVDDLILDIYSNDWAVIHGDREAVAFEPRKLYEALKEYYNE